MPSPVLLLAAVAALFASGAAPLDLQALAGAPPSAAAAVLGAPVHGTAPTPDAPFFDLEYRLGTAFPSALQRGTLTVSYCGGRATSFVLQLPLGAPTPEALLGLAGYPVGQLALTGDARGHKEWGPRVRGGAGRLARAEGLQLERVVASYSLPVAATAEGPTGARGAGWATLVVDYSAPC